MANSLKKTTPNTLNNALKIAEYFNEIDKSKAPENKTYELNSKGRIVFNKFGEQTSLVTEGIRFFDFNPRNEQQTSARIYAIYDSHFGTSEAQYEMIARNIHTALELGCYIGLGGDLRNNSIVNSIGDIYRDLYGVRESQEMIEKLLIPADEQKAILFNLSGNHEYRSDKAVGFNQVEHYIKDKNLESEGMAYIRLMLKNKFNPNSVMPLEFAVQHGEAASGGAFGTVQAAINIGKKIFNGMPTALFLGHTHQNAGGSSVSFMPDVNKENGRDKVNTKKSIMYGFAVAPGIPTETYSLKSGAPIANTDAVIQEFVQVKNEKGRVYWVCNALDMNLLYAKEHILKPNEHNQLRKAQQFLTKQEQRMLSSVKELPVESQMKVYNKFIAKQDNLAQAVVDKYGITKQDLDEHYLHFTKEK